MVAPNSPSTPPSEPPEDDPMGPPKVPCEVECIHCGNVYLSSEIRWQPDPKGPGGGWWVCPIEGCDGAGFCFDIFPTNPDVGRGFGVESWDFEEDDDDEADYDDDVFEVAEPWKNGTAGDDDGDDEHDGPPYNLFDDERSFLAHDADPSERPPPPRRRLTDGDDPCFSDDDIPF